MWTIAVMPMSDLRTAASSRRSATAMSVGRSMLSLRTSSRVGSPAASILRANLLPTLPVAPVINVVMGTTLRRAGRCRQRPAKAGIADPWLSWA